MTELSDGLKCHVVRNGTDGIMLRGGYCSSCAKQSFPATRRCRSCGSKDVAEVDMQAQGTIYASTIARVAQPGFTAPYSFGYVSLDDGPRVFARLCDRAGAPALFPPGTRVELAELDLQAPTGPTTGAALIFVETGESNA